MTRPDRLDPLSFSGCFAELESDIPAGVTLPAWRSQRTSSSSERPQATSATSGAGRAGADLAPQDRTLRLRVGRGPGPRSFPHSGQLLAGALAARRERRAALRRLGRDEAGAGLGAAGRDLRSWLEEEAG